MRYKLSNMIFYGACFILVTICLMAIFAPVLTTWNPSEVNIAAKLQEPSSLHILGTDHMGRDLFARLLYAGRISLFLAVVVSFLVVCLGAPIGLIIGWYGGKIEAVGMWFIGIVMAFPPFLLALALAGIFGQGMSNLILCLTIVEWVIYARILCNMTQGLKHREYIINAHLMGANSCYIIYKHVLPFVYKPLLIIVLLNMGNLILMISGFSFLGVGVQPSIPEWGMMIFDAKSYFRTRPELMLYPGLAIFLTVVCFNIIGEHLGRRKEVSEWRS